LTCSTRLSSFVDINRNGREREIMKSKIYILGSVASGKTTLARKLSNLLDIPWHELDNVVHLRLPEGDRKRRDEERDLVFDSITNGQQWIIEGVFRPCFNHGFDRADVIILLDTPPFKRKYRIAKRWIAQRLKIEKANYVPTLKMLRMMYKWSNDFEKTKGELLQTLEPHGEKVIVLKNNRNILSIAQGMGYGG